MASKTEQIYSADQIRIPAEFPDILKNYSKFIIRKQPGDLIAASAEYASTLLYFILLDISAV
jgi:hypothetical protein